MPRFFGLFVASCAGTSALLAQSPSPFQQEMFATSGAPEGLAAGDLNADGHEDLVIANSGAGTMSVMLARSDGTFEPHIQYGMGSGPKDIALADLNGDGKLDAISANSSPGTASRRLGNGSGGFGSLATYATQNGSCSVGVGDFNGDTLPDLAVANGFANTVSLLLGTGGGAFAPATPIAVGGQPVSIAVGDFDSDGKLDFVVACQSAAGAGLLLGDGLGGFAAPILLATHLSPREVSAADVDGDGNLDLAVANRNSHDVSFLRGLGGASFSAPVQLPVNIWPIGVRLADFSGDGLLDVVALHDSPLTELVVFPGDGTGSFGAATTRTLGGTASFMELGDFDANGRLDAAVTSSPQDVVLVLHDVEAGPGLVTSFADQYVEHIAFGDLNQDGHLDLVSIGGAVNQYPDCYALSFGNAQGSPVYQSRVNLPDSPSRLELLHLDNDGVLDLVIAYGIAGKLCTYPGLGNGVFGAVSNTYTLANGSYDMVSGDWNEDTFPDLAVTWAYAPTAWLLFGDGQGGFVTPLGSVPISSFTICTGDLNLDGHADLVAGRMGGVSVLLGAGDGTFAAPVPYNTVNDDTIGVAIGDVDGDGKPDVLASAGSGPSKLHVLRGDGVGGLVVSQVIAMPNYFRAIEVTDIDGDGIVDVFCGGGSAPWFVVCRGDGAGSLFPPRLFCAGEWVNDAYLVNLDCDDVLDVVMPGQLDYHIIVSHGIDHSPPSTNYCTAKINALGCVPQIGSTGVPRASSTSGFEVQGANVRNNKSGLLFYGVSGAAAIPFQGGTLCIKSPLKRAPGVSSSGNPAPANDCSGVYRIDMNRFASGGLGGTPLPELLVPCTLVYCQWWGRDPGFVAPNNTTLTDALEYEVRL